MQLIFCVLLLYSENILNLFLSSNSILVTTLALYTYKISCHLQIVTVLLLSELNAFYFFLFLLSPNYSVYDFQYYVE